MGYETGYTNKWGSIFGRAINTAYSYTDLDGARRPYEACKLEFTDAEADGRTLYVKLGVHEGEKVVDRTSQEIYGLAQHDSFKR